MRLRCAALQRLHRGRPGSNVIYTQFAGSAGYGPEKPITTPPGARTITVVTPSVTRVGAEISSAPSRSALSNAACASATWMNGVVPGPSGGFVGRIPPPPLLEYANK